MPQATSPLRQTLAQHGQEHVLRFYDQLPPASRKKLESQLNSLDLGLMKRLADEYVRRKPEIHLPRDIQPVKAYPRAPVRRSSTRTR